MAYVRKTVDEFDITQFTELRRWEVVFTGTSRKEAREIVEDYRDNQPGAYRIVVRRVKIEG